MRFILLLMALAAIAGCSKSAPDNNQQASAEVDSPVKGVDRSHAGQPAPEVEMLDGEETPASLASLDGKPALVNFWAIWCAPCVKELPTLDALSKQPRVVAVSEDSATRATVDAFLDDHQLSDMEAWRDPEMGAGTTGVQILPTTILYGSDGKEIWRYVGDLDWTGPEANKLLAEAR